MMIKSNCIKRSIINEIEKFDLVIFLEIVNLIFSFWNMIIINIYNLS